MARLNARQKRAKKRNLALHELALSRNPSMIPEKGKLRSSTGPEKVLLSQYQPPRENWEGLGQRKRTGSKLWGITGSVNGDFREGNPTPATAPTPVSPNALLREANRKKGL